MKCYLLFENEDTYSDVHKRIACKIYVVIGVVVIKVEAQEVETASNEINKREVTHVSCARIWYIGGYCVAKVRHKYIVINRKIKMSMIMLKLLLKF